MNYKRIQLSTDPNVTGKRGGGAQIELDESLYEKDQLAKIRSYFSGINWDQRDPIPDFDFVYYAKLTAGAKLTDFLYFSPFFIGCPFIVSANAYETMNRFKLQRHFTFDVEIQAKNEVVEGYKLFYCPLLDYSVINWSESIFFTGSELLGKKYFSCSNSTEFRSQNKVVGVEKLAFNDSIDSTVDLISARLGGVYFSEKLSETLEGCSGLKFKEPIEPELVFS